MVQEDYKKVRTPITYIDTFKGVELWVKRDDQLHTEVSGNKWYKLFYHIIKAKKNNTNGILTFGGAYSNHLLATAAFCFEQSIPSIGYVRGEGGNPLNPTLDRCSQLGMQLHFISRTTYRQKEDPSFLGTLMKKHTNHWIIPEGGAGWDGICGAQLMLDERCSAFDVIACPVGTGTTAIGLALAASSHQRIWGIPIHKHPEVVAEQQSSTLNLPNNLEVRRFDQYHFGGYAKWNERLISFMRLIQKRYGLALDPIYTGKAMFALFDQIERGCLEPGTKLLFIHTGGLQGNKGFEDRFKLKLYPEA